MKIGPVQTRRVKRRRGKEPRERPCNVHIKKVTTKDEKEKAKEDAHFETLNVFVVIGWNYKRMIPYKTPNSNGKITTTVYKELLDMIKDDLISRGLTLWQDRDSAHNSKGTEAWFSKNNVPYITSPGNSPDLSIWESYAHPRDEVL